MKALFLALTLFLTGCVTKSHVVPPSTTEVRNVVVSAKTSTTAAQVSNEEAHDAVLAAQMSTASLRKKLELLKANYPH
jgi:hypothetical protein